MTVKYFNVKNGLSAGTITLDAATGNTTSANLTVTGKANLGAVGNLTLTGGSLGYFLQTDGTGNLSFVSPASLESPAPMPYYIPSGTNLIITDNYQGLYSVPITVDGTLEVEGILVQVDGIVGTSNSQIIFDNQGTTTGSPNLTFTTTTNTLTVPVVKTQSTTVANLPSASVVGAGARAFVTDATTKGFLDIVNGGGSNKVPVVSDGSNWYVG